MHTLTTFNNTTEPLTPPSFEPIYFYCSDVLFSLHDQLFLSPLRLRILLDPTSLSTSSFFTILLSLSAFDLATLVFSPPWALYLIRVCPAPFSSPCSYDLLPARGLICACYCSLLLARIRFGSIWAQLCPVFRSLDLLIYLYATLR